MNEFRPKTIIEPFRAEVILAVHAQRDHLPGYRIVQQTPVLRHFTARLEPIREHRKIIY